MRAMHDGLDIEKTGPLLDWLQCHEGRFGGPKAFVAKCRPPTDRQLLANVPSEDPQHSRLKGSGAMLKTSVQV